MGTGYGGVWPAVVICLLAGSLLWGAEPVVGDQAVELRSGSNVLAVSLRSPRLAIGDRRCEPAAPTGRAGSLAAGQTLTATYAPMAVPGGTLQVETVLAWSPDEGLLRKWARCRLTSGQPAVLHEVVLEDLPAGKAAAPLPAYSGQSYPAFLAGFFAGIEFPIASTRVERDRLRLAHRPGVTLAPGQWWESRRAVYGVAPVGQERAAFERYVLRHRPQPAGLHFDYNSWWTSPVPYSEQDIAGLLDTFRRQLSEPYGASFDSFCIDAGWSEPKSVWEIKGELFPRGFAGIQQAAAGAGTHLGLWISPSSAYNFTLDNEWAAAEGYETFTMGQGRYACLAGQRYREALQRRLVEMATRYGLRQVKFDGYVPTCPEAGHGHQPGEESAEAIADGIISVFAAVRKAAPDLWMEPTCFGWNPSPWWLWHVNSLIGTYGDDAPYGRVPCPVYRESYTTARDFFNLQGAARLPIPIAAQEVLGICHQTPDDLTNDAVMTIMRGHQFVPVYLNPAHMSPRRWRALAALMRWARANAGMLATTEPLLPADWVGGRAPAFTNDAAMPRQPYGYAHWLDGKGLVCLRNPWLRSAAYPVRLPAGLRAGCSVVSIYPERRLYERAVRPGGELVVDLAPYETVVLSIAPGQPTAGLPPAHRPAQFDVLAYGRPPEPRRVTLTGPEGPFGPDWTALVAGKTAAELLWQGKVEILAPQAELLVLLEDDRPAPVPFGSLQVDGKETPLSVADSATGWAASGQPMKEHWVFLRAPVGRGSHQISLRVLAGERGTLSVWLWGKEEVAPGEGQSPVLAETPGTGRSLPAPEVISRSSQAVALPTDLAALPATTGQAERPVERIQGIFLDTLAPVSASQGWGTLQRNQSVWEKPLQIGERRYHRGLGTHSPSRLVYDLGKQYKRFQAWAGADHATGPTVTFEVWVDGQKRWESGLMRREDAAKRVDVDVTGAARLDLVVGDGGNGIGADHADWAEAVLIR